MNSSRHEPASSFILTLSCPDTVGIVGAVSQQLAAHGALITEAHHFREPISNSTVLRIVFESAQSPHFPIAAFEDDFEKTAMRFNMKWRTYDAKTRTKVLVAVSKHGHCLKSLLHRWETGTLPIEVVGVVSNHETQRRLVEWYGLPFHFYPIAAGKKAEQ